MLRATGLRGQRGVVAGRGRREVGVRQPVRSQRPALAAVAVERHVAHLAHLTQPVVLSKKTRGETSMSGGEKGIREYIND